VTETLLAMPELHRGHVASLPVSVQIRSHAAIARIGLVEALRGRSEIRLVADDRASARVVLAVADVVDAATVRAVRALHHGRGLDVVAVVGRLDARAAVALTDAGACCVLSRGEASADRLVQVLLAAARGPAAVPSRAPGALTAGGTPTVLTDRERDVLELIAEGLSTREVAAKLCYSERTIKNALQDLTVRLNLRNRTQAVAHAVRMGWI
jgi:DNA-binding NarL/FixJ family response regulator